MDDSVLVLLFERWSSEGLRKGKLQLMFNWSGRLAQGSLKLEKKVRVKS